MGSSSSHEQNRTRRAAKARKYERQQRKPRASDYYAELENERAAQRAINRELGIVAFRRKQAKIALECLPATLDGLPHMVATRVIAAFPDVAKLDGESRTAAAIREMRESLPPADAMRSAAIRLGIGHARTALGEAFVHLKA